MAEREPAEDGHQLGQLHVGGSAQEQPPQERGRWSQAHHRSAGDEAGTIAVDDDRAAVDERLRHLANEEGVAPAGVDHGVGQLRVRSRTDDAGGQSLALRPVEGLEVDDRAPAVERHPLPQPVELSRAGPGSQGGDGEDGEVGEADEQRRQRQRFAVGGVEVFEHHHHRCPGPHGLDEGDRGGEHRRQVLDIGGGVARLLDLSTQCVGAASDGTIGHQPREHIAEHGERDPVVEVVGPPHHDRVAALLGSGG
jgi:hypothetical protein